MNMGSLHSELFGQDFAVWMAPFIGGAMVGFGTRLAGGCTSGRGLSGVSRLAAASLVATASFFGAAIIFPMAIHYLDQVATMQSATLRDYFFYSVSGVATGIALRLGGLSDFEQIPCLFLSQNIPRLPVLVGAIGLCMCGFLTLCRKRDIPKKQYNGGTIPGGIMFGAGWAMTGACPSIALVQPGEVKNRRPAHHRGDGRRGLDIPQDRGIQLSRGHRRPR